MDIPKEYCKDKCDIFPEIERYRESLEEEYSEGMADILDARLEYCETNCRAHKLYSWLNEKGLICKCSDEFKKRGIHGPDKPF